MALQITNIVEAQPTGGTRKKKGGYKWWKPKELRQLRALVTEGKTVREIAEIMGMSRQRMWKAKHLHIKRIRRKTGVVVKARPETHAMPEAKLSGPLLFGVVVGIVLAALVALAAR